MGLGTGDVFHCQTFVETDRGVDLLHDRRWTAREPATPHLVGCHDWSPGMKIRIVAIASGCAVVAVAAVLYGIGLWNVHAGARPPAVLNRLQVTASHPTAPGIGFN